MTTETPKRPTPRDVRERVAVRIAAILHKWTGDANQKPEDFMEESLDLAWNAYDGGYEHARRLDDNHGYQPDLYLVEELDGVADIVREEVNLATRAWVRDNSIACPFALEESVRIAKGNIPGVITKIDNELAECTVFCESLCHVRHGVGANGRICKYEELTPSPVDKSEPGS